MRRIHIWAALITGVPLGLLIAGGYAPRDTWLPLILAAILCGALVGIPQGYLAARLVSRPNVGRFMLVSTILIAGFVMSIIAEIVAANVSGVLPGRWVPLPGPPVRVSGLIGPTCYRLPDLRDPSLRYSSMRVYVQAHNNVIYTFDERPDWTVIEKVPEPDPRCSAEPYASTAQSQLVIHQRTVDCSNELHLELRQDGSLWYWRRGRCAAGVGAVQLLSIVLSLVAGVVVVRSHRVRSTAAP